MSSSNPFSDRLREPLNETTRKARRNLLAAAVVGVVIAKVGLVPTKISAFGVDFTSANQESLLLLLACAIGYFSITFVVYLYSELIAWQLVFRSKEMEQLKEEANRNIRERDSDMEMYFHDRTRRTYFQAKPAFFLRIFVELVVPLVFAGYSALALLNTEPSSSVEPANNSSQQDARKSAASA
ncbi:hypothetical protein [Vibrio metschnikovii]|uniref:hypothetical protein n=1 Tax=Vibrio metschnikovii TaxID=28172 RepID=UPI00164C6DE8|nr:hypothetical protein [Vibrio metschnikovii]MBC5831559.1 hypothetical protein [Vibrio metschnikovii]